MWARHERLRRRSRRLDVTVSINIQSISDNELGSDIEWLAIAKTAVNPGLIEYAGPSLNL